jgi:predicted phage terminase large subunit-like protein
MRNGERIEELNVHLMDVINPQNARDIAIRTTIKPDGQADTVRRQLIPHPDARRTCATDTASALMSTTQYLTNRAENAPSAENLRLQKTPAPIGTENSALTTATTPAKSEDFCVTTATLRSGTEKPKKLCSKPLNTYELTLDSVIEITAAGREDVFDIQVERTENFIANGLVSHNTRWHEDDLTGWLLSEEQGDEPENWTVVCLPAIADETPRFPETCSVVRDERSPGDALCPERYPAEKLNKIRARIGEYHFGALYQQRPIAKSGLMFDVSRFDIVDAVPVGTVLARGWDKAATPGGGDWTVGVKLGKCPDNTFIVTDVERGQWDTAKRDRQIRLTAEIDGLSVKQYGEQEPGSAGVSDAKAFIQLLSGFPVEVEKVSGDKVTRADAFSSQVNAGNVKLLRGDWNKKYKDELQSFPKGKNDDQVDGSSLAFNKLTNKRIVQIEETTEEYQEW